MTDSLFADVSEFQVPVNDSYPYRIFSCRASDGDYQDHNFAANYAWMTGALNDGRLDCGIVYSYWRSDWSATANTLINMVNAAGGPHPKMIAMIDLESGGNPSGDQSDPVNRTYWALTDWLGTTNDVGTRRVIGYANANDFYSMWPTRPDGLRVIGAGYGSNPNLPGQIAHQYTDGTYGADPANGLPSGCSPFGNCDMNSADGLSSTDFAAQCGITGDSDMQLTDTITDAYGNQVSVGDVLKWISYHTDLNTDQLGGPGTRSGIPANFAGWPDLGNRTIVDALAKIGSHLSIPGFIDPDASKAA